LAVATIELTSENFVPTVEREGIVLVDCWARWCAACKPFAPVFERVAERHPGHTFGKIDTQAETKLTERLGVDHVPSLLLYRDGILVFRQPGYFDEEQLDDVVRQAESLDMDEVRAHIAAENGGRQ
jgi:thioredoxin 1